MPWSTNLLDGQTPAGLRRESTSPALGSPAFAESMRRIARLAAGALDVPIVSITLLGDHHQWSPPELLRCGDYRSLCAMAAGATTPYAVADLRRDPDLARHPLVTGPPGLRSMMVAPLGAGGGNGIGSLSALDIKPRACTSAELQIARDFARLIEDILPVAATRQSASATPRGFRSDDADASLRAVHRLRAIADSVPAMIGYWNRDLRCEFANERYRGWFGMAPEDVLGRHMPEILGSAVFKLNEPYARKALAGQEQRFERALVKIDGSLRITDARYIPDHDPQGNVPGFFVLVTDITELRETYDQIRGLAQRLESVREDERRAVAHVLHESLAQDLYAVRLCIDEVESLIPGDVTGLPGWKDAKTALERCIAGSRQVANDLWPESLAHHGIVAVLQHHVVHVSRLTGLSIRVVEQSPLPAIGESPQLVLFRAAQELLRNVSRHARAQNVTISLTTEASRVAMEVVDDGIGMGDYARPKFGAFGLVGLRERCAQLGGTLQIHRHMPRGTRVRVELPCPAD